MVGQPGGLVDGPFSARRIRGSVNVATPEFSSICDKTRRGLLGLAHTRSKCRALRPVALRAPLADALPAGVFARRRSEGGAEVAVVPWFFTSGVRKRDVPVRKLEPRRRDSLPASARAPLRPAIRPNPVPKRRRERPARRRPRPTCTRDECVDACHCGVPFSGRALGEADWTVTRSRGE